MEEKRYLKRKQKAQQDGNREQLAIACNVLGDYYNQEGKYQNAMQEYEEEAQLYAKLNKKLEMAKAHRMIGEMYMLLCEFDKATEHINIYLKTVKQLQNKVEEQRAYATLGRAYLLHGQSLSETSAAASIQQLQQAEKAFLRSLLLIKDLSGLVTKLEQLDMQARCYLNIGVVKEHMEQFEESLQYIEKAIKISKSNELFELTHLCYISMSLLYHCKKNDATSALRCCNLAYDQAKRLPDKVKKLCETLITKSEILIKEGDFASAKHILTKAYKKNTPNEADRAQIEKTLRIVVKICRILDELVTTNSTDFASRKTLYEKLGDGCCQLGNFQKAIEYYLLNLECAKSNNESEKTLIPIYVSLYQTYKDAKEYDKALEYLWKEYELNKDVPAEAFTTLCGIAEVCELQMQPYWTTQDVYQKALEQASKAPIELQKKLERIAYARLKKLQLKHKMNVLAEELDKEANEKGINLDCAEDESDDESEGAGSNEQNTPDLGDDVCLEDLTDSDASDLDETDKPRPHRTTRGTRALTIKRNNKGETQLHQACISGNLELARRLIEQGHVVNVRDHAGWLPLHEAANHGFCEIVALLLDRGATAAINDKGGTSCDGITPLYDACSNGYMDVAELLIERGADVTVRTDFGETCLQGLDKWRSTANLIPGEQAQYTQLRNKLLQPLSKLGITTMSAKKPLTNADVHVKSNSNTNSEDDENEDELRALRHRKSNPDGNKILMPYKERNKKPSPRSPNAKVEYKNVMAQLKRPSRLSIQQQDADDEVSTTYPNNKSKRSAFLSDDEVDDDWLIDDLGREKKKRRYDIPIINEPRSTSNPVSTMHSTRHSTSKENLHDSGNYARDKYDSLIPETDAFQLLLDNATSSTSIQPQKAKPMKKLSLSRSSSISSNNSLSLGTSKTKHQASLLDSGFCRFRSVSPVTSDDSNDPYSRLNIRATCEPDSSTNSIHLIISPSKSKCSPLKVQSTPPLSSTVPFKIKVEDELLLVPIERRKLNEINIRWLAEEAARRYYNLVGLRPVLRLKTADGFAYEENDPVNVALEQCMILATVMEWKIPPLGLRYEEMCQQCKKEMNPAVQKTLEYAQSSNVLQFENQWLTPELTEPIFKAILHQHNLSILDLTNNFIQNDGCRQLAKSLPTLKQLKQLSLAGNFITSEGLDILLSAPNVNKLEHLETINLSQNPLGNNAVHILAKHCQSDAGKALQRLELSHCHITNLYDFDLCYHQLVAFDISFNQLTNESMRRLLSQLNACRLSQLNLSYTHSLTIDERSSLAFGERIVTFFESGTCQKFKNICLAGCHLSDTHLYKIVQCLTKATDLELLDITDNDKLSGLTLQVLLQELTQLRKLNATNCSRLIDGEHLAMLTSSNKLGRPELLVFSLPADLTFMDDLYELWQRHWGVTAKKMLLGNKLILYVDEKDLCHC